MIDIPKTGVADFIRDLAKSHNVTCVETNIVRLAETISQLSDDVVVKDGIEMLISALYRADVINLDEFVKLLRGYLHEKRTNCDG